MRKIEYTSQFISVIHEPMSMLKKIGEKNLNHRALAGGEVLQALKRCRRWVSAPSAARLVCANIIQMIHNAYPMLEKNDLCEYLFSQIILPA